MTVDQIKDAINRKYPEYDLNTESLRGILGKHKNMFNNFSRTSTYGLRKWENEKDNIMGGTISDIVEKYLGKAQKPKHISEIYEYVFKYRPGTSITSIRPNLILEKDNRFTFFPGNYATIDNSFVWEGCIYL